MSRKVEWTSAGLVDQTRQNRQLYRSARIGGTIDVHVGDTVELDWNAASEYAIVLSMFGVVGRPKEKYVEVLWFDKLRGKEPQELLITAIYSPEPVSSIRRKIEVLSKDQYDLLPNKAKRQRRGSTKKGDPDNHFFCRYGLELQSQVTTKELDWSYTYTQEDRQEPKEFHIRIDEIIKRHAVAEKPALKKRLESKITYDNIEDELVAASDSSDDASGSPDSEDDEISAPAPRTPRKPGPKPTTPRKRKPRARSLSPSSGEEAQLNSEDQEDDDDFIDDDDVPKTPRKRKRPAKAATPKTPRTPRTPRKSTVVSTPGSGRSYRVHAPLEVTPLPSRVYEKDGTLLSPHQLARQRLHVAEVPDSLPCREDEFAAIYEQVESAIQEGESSLVYVSGTPGTGKTATVREVVKVLQQRAAEGDIFPFRFVEINGMKMPDPVQAYSKLWECLMGQRVTPAHALSLLQREFSKRNPLAQACVVLMDELDQLTTTKQDVMYNFFQWPNMPRTKLIVVAVANTMDLPERTLAHKVSSRLGLTRIAFPAYTRDQLVTIVKSRVKSVAGIEVEDAAITYACMRVSRVSGDARRALDICRRAVELAEPEFGATPRHRRVTDVLNGAGSTAGTSAAHPTPPQPHGKVTLAVMRQAFEQMTSSPLQRYLLALSLTAKLLLRGLVACTTRSGLQETTLGDVVEDCVRMIKVNSRVDLERLITLGDNVNGKASSASRKNGVKDDGMLLSQPVAMLRVAQQLAESAIIYLEKSPSVRHCRLRLKVPESELVASWSEDSEMIGVS
ncbi:Origin recognition complex, subunit 1 [Savitreella phatthalungensis]